jgi:hypothetical protein
MADMDSETGEIISTSNALKDHGNFDIETGEFEPDNEMGCNNYSNYLCRKSKFTIPKAYLTHTKRENKNIKCYLSTQETFSLTSKRRIINLKEVSATLK